MRVGELCNRTVISIDASSDIVTAAQLMRIQHVGFLVVLDSTKPQRAPVGVITDRDIVVQVDAKAVDSRSIKVSDVMTRNPIVATEMDDVLDLIKGMKIAGIRRVPVVNAVGNVTGVIALDDLIEWLASTLCTMTGIIVNEQRKERRTRVS